MFAGHIGVALGLGRIERRLNVGVLVTAAVLLDLILWLLVIAGVESVTIPANFTITHQPEFMFPYSHGLLASVAWSAIAGAIAYGCFGSPAKLRGRIAALVAAAVFSHWLLDALVHRPELPLAGAASVHVGLGLWGDMPVALGVECAIALAGLLLFLRGSAFARGRSSAMIALTAIVAGFTVIGMTRAPPPPSASAMAVASAVTLVIVCVLYLALGRIRTQERK